MNEVVNDTSMDTITSEMEKQLHTYREQRAQESKDKADTKPDDTLRIVSPVPGKVNG